MIPIFVVFMLIPSIAGGASKYIALAIFCIASFTDFLDGKIARKYNLVTDFGKFMDPLADKLLVIGTMLCVVYKFEVIRPYFFWAVLLVIFRELTVTGLRALAAAAPSGHSHCQMGSRCALHIKNSFFISCLQDYSCAQLRQRSSARCQPL